MDSVFSNLSKMIEQVGKDKGIDRNIVIEAVEQGLLTAARKKYGTYREIEAQYNEETGDVELFVQATHPTTKSSRATKSKAAESRNDERGEESERCKELHEPETKRLRNA